MKNFDDAEVIFVQLLHSQRKEFGYKHPRVAKILSNIGCVHYECGGLLAAKKAFEEALEIQRGPSDQSDSDLLALSYTLCNMGFIHAQNQSYDTAVLLFEEALDIQRSILREDHPTLEITEENLNRVLQVSNASSPTKRAMCQFSDIYSEAIGRFVSK